MGVEPSLDHPRPVTYFCEDRITASGKPVVYSSSTGTAAVSCT